MSESFIHAEYPVAKGDYTRAGEASTDIKRRLRQLGVGSNVMRRVAVASYEAGLNLGIHSQSGPLDRNVFPDRVELVSEDVGPGIPDLSLAMREGWSTANEEARSLGFGAGMGLPNMKRHADEFDIQSEVGKGTVIRMGFRLA